MDIAITPGMAANAIGLSSDSPGGWLKTAILLSCYRRRLDDMFGEAAMVEICHTMSAMQIIIETDRYWTAHVTTFKLMSAYTILALIVYVSNWNAGDSLRIKAEKIRKLYSLPVHYFENPIHYGTAGQACGRNHH